MSPETAEFIRSRRDTSEPPGEEVADFEEYTRLYREAWSDPDIRWLLSTVPSLMIFDDHDVIDDWNISWQWLEDARAKPWWHARITGAFMAYWIYQHLGNLSPPELERGGDVPHGDRGRPGRRARSCEAFAERADRESAASRWACCRDFGRSRVLVVDSRAARVLDDDHRDMVDEEEWAWIVERSHEALDHLVIVSTLPVFMSPGVHYLEAWNEAVCAGAWGRPAAWLGERHPARARPRALAGVPGVVRADGRPAPGRRDAAPGATAAGVDHARRRRHPQRLRRRGVARPPRQHAQPRPSARLLAVSQPARADASGGS